MKTIRRLYVYVVALIGVEVVVWGTIGLLRSIFKTQDIANSPSELAQALALILVGVPIFLIHWTMAQRAAAKEEEEHSSTLRALFLYGILLGGLIPSAQSLLALINRIMLWAARLSGGLAVVGGTQSWSDNVIAMVVNLAAAAYFFSILRANRKELVEAGRFDEVRRLYRVVWVSYGLILTIYGAQQALNFAFNLPSRVLGSIGPETALNGIALLLVGAPIWAYAWKSLQAALPQANEQESYLRLGFLYLLSMIGMAKFAVPNPYRTKVADALAGRGMSAYRITDFGRHPHAATTAMLLEVDLIHRPQIDGGISGEFSEFFCVPPGPAGRRTQSGAEVCVIENRTDETVVGTVGRATSRPVAVSGRPTTADHPKVVPRVRSLKDSLEGPSPPDSVALGSGAMAAPTAPHRSSPRIHRVRSDEPNTPRSAAHRPALPPFGDNSSPGPPVTPRVADDRNGPRSCAESRPEGRTPSRRGCRCSMLSWTEIIEHSGCMRNYL